MTEFKLKVEDTQGTVLEQSITNEKSYDDFTLQEDIDKYIHEYITTFAQHNSDKGVQVKKLQLIHSDGHTVRELTKNLE
jgi:hypothetical protein